MLYYQKKVTYMKYFALSSAFILKLQKADIQLSYITVKCLAEDTPRNSSNTNLGLQYTSFISPPEVLDFNVTV